MELRANLASWCSLAAILAALCLPVALEAQVEAFNNAALPAGWNARLTPANTGDLWAVDASPNSTPGSAVAQPFPITPFSSPPFSLNFNNGTSVATGTSAPTNAGILMPAVDLTFAPSTPGPVLRFNHMQHRWYTFPTDYHLCEVVVWDAQLTTVMHVFNVSCSNGTSYCPWAPISLNLNAQWGNVRFEFRYRSNYAAPIQDAGSAGWFIDDVEVANLNPPAFAIIESPVLPSVAVGTPVNIQFTAANNVGALNNWRVQQGSLPIGTTLDANSGLLSGTPTDSGSYSFQILVDDSAVPIPSVAAKWFSMAVTRSPSFVYPVVNLPFDDDFASDKGWVFSTDDPPGIPVQGPGPAPYADVSAGGWERGATFQSPPGQWTQDNRDPVNDNTSTSDNMLLGVKVGGRWNDVNGLVGLRKYWAYTPELNVGGLREITVSFDKWLNAHNTEVPSRVEIWNPTTDQWQLVWSAQTTADDHDNSWVSRTADIDFGATPGGSDTSRVRFGWWVTTASVSGATYGSSGFNIDNVLIQEKPQPNILIITQAKISAPGSPISAPYTYQGLFYPLILQVTNTSTVPIEVTTFWSEFYSMLGGNPTEQNQVGQFHFSPALSTSTPWLVPAGTNFFICNIPASPGPVDGQFESLDVCKPPLGSGATVFFHCKLFGRETAPSGGNPAPRSVVADSADMPTGNTKISPSLPPPVTINPPLLLPAANLGQPYQYTFSASGGAPPYHSWNMTAGPGWITFDPVNARISGTPPAQQNYQVTIEVFDSNQPTNTSDTKTFTIPVVNVGPQPIQIATSSQLPNATESQLYPALVFNASGGTPPYVWSQVGGSLPVGMTFSAPQATLSGTPGAGTTGQYTIQIRVRDSGNPITEVTRTFFLSVLPAEVNVSITTPETGPGSPPDGLETEPYNGAAPFQFTATGGFVSGPNSYRWAVVSGTFPPGLVLNPVTGQISGTPTLQGQYAFDLRVSDGAFPPSTFTGAYAINIDPLVPVPMFISSKAILDPGFESNPYSVQLGATYGKAPLTWRVQAGSVLPAGLVLNTSAGQLAGVITRGQAATPDEDFVFTIEVLDSSSPQQIAEKEFHLNISAFVNGILTILTPEDLPEGGVEFAYSAWLQATGGSPVDPSNPYQWILSPGSSLPLGLTLGVNGNISGIVPLLEDDTYTFTVEVNDGAGNLTSRTFTLQINDYEKPPEGPTIEIESGRTRVETVPFWEACSVGAGAGAGFAPFAAMAVFAMLRRRRML